MPGQRVEAVLREHGGERVPLRRVAGRDNGVQVQVVAERPHPQPRRRQGEDPGPAANVEHRAAGHRQPLDRDEARARRLVIAGPKRVPGLDDDDAIPLDLVPRCGDREPRRDVHRLEVLLPPLVPVLLGLEAPRAGQVAEVRLRVEPRAQQHPAGLPRHRPRVPGLPQHGLRAGHDVLLEAGRAERSQPCAHVIDLPPRDLNLEHMPTTHDRALSPRPQPG